jgi:hypothetical protein
LDGENALKYTGFPLANIGNLKPAGKVWVPLEMLEVHHEQVLRRCGHFTEEIQVSRDAILRLPGGIHPMRKCADEYIDILSQVGKVWEAL